ncbi:Purine catabolism regulatory protein [Mycobacteroides salmoniphilum]|uniref:Purine catabolism regulatory protein n=1 Tax=Mycobacteroides salmoniphilum TaxID=404941 RepID=A0A4R8S0Q9_9MYCO|nr:PucR family transcriptional regulator [Mycobacteroides salmoniphilum]TDZ80129.1 Purine catabolism regulatory protein [Mycobacteroides salmoniphilum]
MQVTVQDVIDLDVVAAGDPEVLSGRSNMGRLVRWVHVADIDDVAAILVGNELVLTTGIGMNQSGSASAKFIDQLVQAGAAGLVVELSPNFPRIPPAALRAARGAELPVIVLHRPVRFVEVTERVHRRIVTEQSEIHRFAAAVNEVFTELNLARAGFEKIVSTAEELAGSPVVLEDLSRGVLASASSDIPRAVLLIDWERRSRTAAETGRHGQEPDGGISERWMSRMVGPGQQRWGRLVILASDREERARIVLERASRSLELARMMSRDDMVIGLQVQAGLLAEILDEQLESEAQARDRLVAMGISSTRILVGLAVRFADSGSLAAGDRGLLNLGGEVRQCLDESGADAVTGLLGSSHVVALIGAASEQRLRRTVADFAHRCRRIDPEVLCAKGTETHAVLEVASSVRSARTVVDAAANQARRPGHCFTQADIRLEGLLLALRHDARLQEFAEAELGALLNYEARHTTGLVDLLRTFLAVGGSKSELARRSHRNRTALYPRLAKLEAILGHSLDDPASRLSLSVALLAHDQARDALDR